MASGNSMQNGPEGGDGPNEESDTAAAIMEEGRDHRASTRTMEAGVWGASAKDNATARM